MKRIILLSILFGLLFVPLGLIGGWILGANIGGNYFTDFEFWGVRGYEAVGKIGSFAGGFLGALLAILLGVRVGSKKK